MAKRLHMAHCGIIRKSRKVEENVYFNTLFSVKGSTLFNKIIQKEELGNFFSALTHTHTFCVQSTKRERNRQVTKTDAHAHDMTHHLGMTHV